MKLEIKIFLWNQRGLCLLSAAPTDNRSTPIDYMIEVLKIRFSDKVVLKIQHHILFTKMRRRNEKKYYEGRSSSHLQCYKG